MDTVALDFQTDTVLLPPPALSPSATLDLAFKGRHSSRHYAPAPLTLQTLSTLLWCACGVNRTDTGERTAPSAHNWQEIDVFAMLPEGAFRYDARAHQLQLVRAQDLRGVTGTQNFVATAPLNLVYVADFARMEGAKPEEQSFLAGADAACIAQNVYLFCACAGLGTVVRGLIDRKQLAQALGLAPSQHIALAQSVGSLAPA